MPSCRYGKGEAVGGCAAALVRPENSGFRHFRHGVLVEQLIIASELVFPTLY